MGAHLFSFSFKRMFAGMSTAYIDVCERGSIKFRHIFLADISEAVWWCGTWNTR